MQADTYVVVAHVAANDNTLRQLRVIRPGAPFPPVPTLLPNAGPFGVAVITLQAPVAEGAAGTVLQVCPVRVLCV